MPGSEFMVLEFRTLLARYDVLGVEVKGDMLFIDYEDHHPHHPYPS